MLRYRIVREPAVTAFVGCYLPFIGMWQQKQVICEIDADYYQTTSAFLTEGRTLAVGDCIRTFEFFPSAVSLDIAPAARSGTRAR